MERRIRERLIGASVLVMLAVIFIPMMLDNSGQVEQEITETNIPPRPEDGFTSRIVPLPGKEKKKVEDTGAAPGPAAGAVPAPHEVRAPAPEVPAGSPATAPSPLAEEASPAATAGADAPAEARSLQEPAEALPPAAGQAAARVGMTAWVVQLGSFSSEVNATALSDRARKSGFSAFVEPLRGSKGTSYRVRVGPELRRSDATALRDRLKSVLGVDGIVVDYP